jgi:hypothetical protein
MAVQQVLTAEVGESLAGEIGEARVGIERVRVVASQLHESLLVVASYIWGFSSNCYSLRSTGSPTRRRYALRQLARRVGGGPGTKEDRS